MRRMIGLLTLSVLFAAFVSSYTIAASMDDEQGPFGAYKSRITPPGPIEKNVRLNTENSRLREKHGGNGPGTFVHNGDSFTWNDQRGSSFSNSNQFGNYRQQNVTTNAGEGSSVTVEVLEKGNQDNHELEQGSGITIATQGDAQGAKINQSQGH